MTQITFIIPNAQWLSSNMRFPHWGAEHDRKKSLRLRGEITGLASGLAFNTPVRVIAHIGYPTNATADPGNSAPTLKALIDGMTRAGIWVDDDSKHLIGPDYRRDPNKAPKGHHTVRLEIEPLNTEET